MTDVIALSVVVLSAILSWWLTGLSRRYALRRNMMDMPSSRGSHETPTPRGGGLAIAVTFLVGLLVLSSFGLVDGSLTRAVLVAGTLVSAIGFADDHRHVPARVRLVVHFAAAFWIVFCLLPGIHWLLFATCSVALVWLLNLFNFMDGIDGIAGVEAVTVSFGLVVLAVVAGMPASAWTPYLLFGGAAIGFLFWNFPEARIFMGDSGSGFAGIVVGAFAVHAATLNAELVWACVIMLGCFVVDASLTLFHRALRGQRIYEAHRSHAYQFAARRFDSHVLVTLTIGGINALWLLPISLLVVSDNLVPWVALTIAWTPIVATAMYFRAGTAEERSPF